MTKAPRVKRSRPDLIEEQSEQIKLLCHACSSFDGGLTPIGKHIALSLRLLLHHHGNSRALLEQLDLRTNHFLESAPDLNPRNFLTDCPLCVMHFGGGETKFIPLCSGGDSPYAPRWVKFDIWWNRKIIKDNRNRTFNRRELILNVADTDGGAHVDPALDEAYMDLSRNNSLGWIITEGNIQRPFPAPTMACLRQIAHEVLETLKVKARGYVLVSYAL